MRHTLPYRTDIHVIMFAGIFSGLTECHMFAQLISFAVKNILKNLNILCDISLGHKLYHKQLHRDSIRARELTSVAEPRGNQSVSKNSLGKKMIFDDQRALIDLKKRAFPIRFVFAK